MVLDREPANQTLEKITRAAGFYAVEQGGLYRSHLGCLMRRAIAQGVPREQVIALSVLTRQEAEALIDGNLAACS